MMNRHRPHDLSNASEERLFALFAALALLEPSAGFVDRVVGAIPAFARRSRLDAFLESRWTRFAVAASLFGAAIASAFVLPAAFAAFRLAGPASILSTWIGAVADLFQSVVVSLGAWERLASFSQALGLALAQPKALLLLFANAALAAAAFRGLLALSPRRGTSHVALLS
jgi:hypothetical protein